MAIRTNHYEKIVPFIIFILALVLLFNLVRPLITIILSSVLLSYVTYPLYKRISKKITRKFASITLSLFIVFIIIMIPFSFLTYEVTQQGYQFYNSLSNNIEKGDVFVAKGNVFGIKCISAESKVCLLLNQAETFSAERLSRFDIPNRMQKLLPMLEEKITNFILSLPLIIAQIFLTFVLAYYILKDWETILKQIVNIIPLRTKTTNRLANEFGNVTYTVVYAQLFVAMIQGAVATIGFYIFGVPFPVILGILTAFCTLIPTAGTAIIWIPASLYLILSGNYTHNYWVLGKGIGLLIYSFFVINLIDNLLLAKIVHEKAKVSQITIIIGVIGGAVMFGIMGIFIGPILLPLLMTYFETFKERFR